MDPSELGKLASAALIALNSNYMESAAAPLIQVGWVAQRCWLTPVTPGTLSFMCWNRTADRESQSATSRVIFGVFGGDSKFFI